MFEKSGACQVSFVPN